MTDENLTIRENGSNYEFVLSEGVWNGVDGAGLSGAGTAVLMVEKSSVATKPNGIQVDASSTAADVAFATASFSTLLGGIEVRGAGTASQAAGGQLVVTSLFIAAREVVFGGAIVGGDGAVELIASNNVALQDASVSTTTGSMTIRGNYGDVAAVGRLVGVDLNGAVIASVRGQVTIQGRGGDVGLENYGVWIHGGSKITSSGMTAGAVSVEGIGGNSEIGSGVVISGAGTEITSASGDIGIRGTNGGFLGSAGVEISNGVRIGSTGTGPRAATITVFGTDRGNEVDVTYGVRISDTRIESVDGDITLTGVVNPVPLQFYAAQGLRLERTFVISTGAGPDAARIQIRGSGADGFEIAFGAGVISSVDGDISLFGAGRANHNSGVRIAGGNLIASNGQGNISVAGDGGTGNVSVGLALDGECSVQTAKGSIHLSGTAGFTGIMLGFGASVTSTAASANIEVVGRTRLNGYGVQVGNTASGRGAIAAAAGNVAVLGDKMLFGRNATIAARNGTVSIAPVTPGREISLGSDVVQDPPNALGLMDAELDRVTARVLQVGNLRSGDFRIVGPITQPASGGYGILALVSGGSVIDLTTTEQPDISVDRLVLAVLGAIGADDGLDVQVSRLAADSQGSIFVTNTGSLLLGNLAGQSIRIVTTGDVSIAPTAMLDVSRLVSADLRSGEVILVSNGGAGQVTGEFAGLPEGAAVRASSNGERRITYRGGDGNDIALISNFFPVLENEQLRVREDALLSGNVLSNDTDPDGDPLAITAVNGDASAVGRTITLSSGALLTVNSDGSFTYDPNGAFNRLTPLDSELDSFAYTVSDGHRGTATATAFVMVYGAGAADLIGYHSGEWQVSLSNGSSFENSVWARWADVAWDALRQADVNGDGLRVCPKSDFAVTCVFQECCNPHVEEDAPWLASRIRPT